MKILLHFGTHKTGSTHIQNVMDNNRSILSEHSVLYPETIDSRSGHHELAFALQEKNLDQAQKIMRHYESQLNNHDVILLSSEEFEFIKDYDCFSRIISQYSPTILLYLRRQDKYLESEYNQHVKMYTTRYSQDIFKFYMEFNFNHRFFYYNLIKSVEKGLKAEVKVVSYDTAAKNKSLISDFLKVVGVPNVIQSINMDDKDKNESLSTRALINLSYLNSRKMDRDEHLESMRRLMKLYPLKDFSHEKLLSNKMAKALVDKYRHQNYLVAQEYNNGVGLFDDEYKDNKVISFYDDVDV